MTATPLSRAQRDLWPYVLLMNPASERAAVYDRRYRLLKALASPELVEWAKVHCTQASDWSATLEEPPRQALQRPSWMPTGPLTGWRLLFLWKDGSSDTVLQDIPAA